MARVALNDDRPGRLDTRSRRHVQVALDDDGCTPCSSGIGAASPSPTGPGDSGVSVNPVLTVRLRSRTGYDDDGNPLFSWNDIVTGAAILWTSREEFDADAGFALVHAKAEILYDGGEAVPETAVVVDDSDKLWRVLSVRQVPGRLGFDLERIDAEVS